MTTQADLWLGAVLEAFAETAAMALGFDAPEDHGRRDTLPTDLVGSVMSLQTERGAQIGLFSTPAGCELIARALLGSSPDDPPLDEPDVADAVNEVLNIFAGATKTRMVKAGVACGLTLPMFVHGYIVAQHDQRVRVARVRVAKVDLELFVAVTSTP